MWRCLPLVLALWGVSCGKGKPDPSTAQREPLALRNGLFYEHGSDQPFSGAVKRTYNDGKPSTIIYYRNGHQHLLRMWTPDGRLEIEQRFHQGHLALVATWDRDGEFQIWRKSDELAVEQIQRAQKFLGETNLVSGFVWLQLAAYNGEPQARQFLSALMPSAVTEAQISEINRQTDALFNLGQP